MIMALSQIIYKSNKLVLRILPAPLTAIILIKKVHKSVSQRNEIDVLDSFTTQLLQRKTDRWESLRVKRKVNNVNKSSSTILITSLNQEINTLDIRNYTADKLNEEITATIVAEDLTKLQILVNQCIEYKMCPTGIILQNLLSFYAQNGDRDVIKRLQTFVEEVNPEHYNLNAKFLHYLAEATWIRGNISEALKMFNEVFADNVFLRRKLKLMIKYMIVNVISERSEATLVMIIIFTENLAVKYDDYFLLACVWQICFLSEWYADQCRATEILDRHEKLCNQISNRIHFVVNSALKSHQTEVVNRLFELLLKYNMKTHYTFVLQSLFNYRYWQNDLRSCAEIIQWSLNIGICLSTTQHEQFISLLLHQNKNINTTKKSSNKNATPRTNFQFKF